MPVKRLALSAVLALAACAPKPWTKEGASAEQLRTDQRACEGYELYAQAVPRDTSAPTVHTPVFYRHTHTGPPPALESPLAPGNSPYRLSKLWFSM